MRRIRHPRLVGVVGLIAATAFLLAGVSTLSAHSRGQVVLGSKRFAPYGKGWGKVKPRHLYNGGDASGDITRIHWRHWGHRVARGHGRNSIFKPHGGYYRKSVRIKLKAHSLGHCPHSHRRAYKHLSVRIPKKPGGPLGPWRNWAGGHRTICEPPY
jgi:hypothetical protein